LPFRCHTGSLAFDWRDRKTLLAWMGAQLAQI
jgi:hypothetical protein